MKEKWQDFIIKIKIHKMTFLAFMLFTVLSVRVSWRAMNSKYFLFDALKVFFLTKYTFNKMIFIA